MTRILHAEAGEKLNAEQLERAWRAAWAWARIPGNRQPLLRVRVEACVDVVQVNAAPDSFVRLMDERCELAFALRREAGQVFPWIPEDEDAIFHARWLDRLTSYGSAAEARTFMGLGAS